MFKSATNERKGLGFIAQVCLLGGGMIWITISGVACKGPGSPEIVVPQANTAARDGAARVQMRTIYRAQVSFKAKNDRYGTIAELVQNGDLNQDPDNDRLFRYQMKATEDRFECIATPMIIGTTGQFSYFIDESGRLRGANHKGQVASVSDPVIEQ